MKRLIYFLLTVSVAVSTASCFRDNGTCGIPSGGDGEIMLRLRTTGGYAPSASRGMTFEQENIISDVYVLVFDKDAKLKAIRQGVDVAGTTSDPASGISGTGSFKFSVATSQTSLDTYNLVVLVNAGSILGTTIGTDDASTYLGSTYTDIIAAVYTSVTGRMYASGGTIPMWGETGQVVVSPSLNGHVLQLVRAVARIDVGVGQVSRTTSQTSDVFEWNGMENDGTTPIPFELQDVYVIRPSDRFGVIPEEDNLFAGDPTLPASTGKFDVAQSISLFAFGGTDVEGVTGGRGGWVTRQIYVPEADVLMGAAGAPGDANHTSRTAVVVGGDYAASGTTTYYRLDFANNGTLMNVLRNYLYQFNISKVSGPGYPTVEEAYNSIAINMQAEVLDWNEYSAEIYDDGTNWMRLWMSENSLLTNAPETKAAIVFRNVNSTDRIRFMTNRAFGDITLSLDNGGAFPDPGNTNLIENDRFRVEMITDDAGLTYFEFTALQPYDASAADNPSTLTVSFGRITFTIAITQQTSQKTDWIDGGEIPKDL